MSSNFTNIGEAAQTFKESVADAASLPLIGNELADVRVTEDTQDIYVWDGSAWQLKSGSGGGGSGDVVGPVSATDNALARFDTTTGKLIQNSAASVDDSGNIAATNLSGTNTGDVTITDTNSIDLGLTGQALTAAVRRSGTTIAEDGSGIKVADGGITNTQIAASAAIDATKIADGSISNAEFQSIGISSPLTLADATLSFTTFLSYAKTNKFAILPFSIERGSQGKVSTMYITHDDTTASFSIEGVETSLLGVEIQAIVSGANIELQYKTSSTGTAGSFKYKLNIWS